MDTPLKSLLLDQLRRNGRMTFARYMELCLYHPEFGYYMQGRERTGREGDYFTSSDLHPIFARLMARQAAEMWEILGQPVRFSWIEMGAGRGLFALDFLRWVSASRPDFFEALEYVGIEPGPRQRLSILDRLSAERMAARFRAVATLQEIEPVTGCFFSNELVDAFPVAVVTRAGGKLKEVYVEAVGEELKEKLGPISDTAIAAAVARYAPQLEEGQRAEVGLRATEWMAAVAQKLARGFVLTVDYGDLAPFLFTPQRPGGTLLAYRSHAASENFYAAPGLHDLTAHVNFSALLDAGKEAGLECSGFTSQEHFLVALGESNEFADLYDPGRTEEEKQEARLKLKRLIFPGDAEGTRGMGSVFKVLVQHRGVDAPKLTGLQWARH